MLIQKIIRLISILVVLTVPVAISNTALAVDTPAPRYCDEKNLTKEQKAVCIPRVCDPNKLTAAQLESCKACNKLNPHLKNCLQKNVIVRDLNMIVNFLSALVGIVVIGTIIYGGIQYSLAGDNAQLTGAAKQRIINGFTAFFFFLLIYAFLQWVVPGGVFNS